MFPAADAWFPGTQKTLDPKSNYLIQYIGQQRGLWICLIEYSGHRWYHILVNTGHNHFFYLLSVEAFQLDGFHLALDIKRDAHTEDTDGTETRVCS